MTYAIINTLGLLLDMVGVVLLFKFAVARNEDLNPRGGHPVGFDFKPDPEKIKRYWKYHEIENAGLACIFLGFLLQIGATWCSYND